MRWFRMHADVISNPKLKLLAFEDRWHYVAVCCMKCEGLLDKKRESNLRERLIAAELGLGLREADEVRGRLKEVDLIHDDWQPKGWSKYQYVSDNSTERVRKFRKKQQRNGMKRDETVSVTPPDTDTDTDTDKNIPATRVPDDVNPKAWEDYLQHRRDSRYKKLTPKGENMQFKLLREFSFEDQQRIVDTTIRNGWIGLFPDRLSNPPKKLSYAQQLAEDLNAANK